jgi:hypothetical protein
MTTTVNKRLDRATTIQELYELVAALDRRVPQVHRLGEIEIAESAAQLKAQALKRIEDLERSLADSRTDGAEEPV